MYHVIGITINNILSRGYAGCPKKNPVEEKLITSLTGVFETPGTYVYTIDLKH